MASNKSQAPQPTIPLKVRLLIASYTYIVTISRRSDSTVNRRLLDFFDITSPPLTKPVDSVISSDTTLDPTRNLWFRLYTPLLSSSHLSSLPLLVYFHGGGFYSNTASSMAYDALCRRLAHELHAVVVSVNYRRSPENRFPCPYEDGLETLKFIDESTTEAKSLLPSYADFTRCFLIGDSSGGNIAHHVAVRASKCEFKRLEIVGLICLQPFFGGKERTESELRLANAPMLKLRGTDWMWKAFLPTGSDRDHEAANVSGPNSIDISSVNFPATLIFIGGHDLLQDRQKRYYEWLKENGKEVQLVEYPNAIHSFYAFPEFPESSMCIVEVKKFIQKQVTSMDN